MTRTLTDRDFRDGFWFYRPEEDRGLWKGVHAPDDYQGEHCLSISTAMQTDVSATRRKKWIDQWCQILPSLERIEFLRFSFKVPQRLFDAVSRMKNLVGLDINWSDIASLRNLPQLQNLNFMRLGSSTKLESLDPLQDTRSLLWLEFENIKRIQDLAAIGSQRQLKGLRVCGSMWTTQRIDSLLPIAALHELRFLGLENLKAKDKSLKHLRELQHLQSLRIVDGWWNKGDLDALQTALPNLSINC